MTSGDEQAWVQLLLQGVTVGPVNPSRVAPLWSAVVMGGLERTRLSAYTVLPDGRTVYLPGPHTGRDGPAGLSLHGERVALEGLDEAGNVVRLRDLDPDWVNLFVYVLDLGNGPHPPR